MSILTKSLMAQMQEDHERDKLWKEYSEIL